MIICNVQKQRLKEANSLTYFVIKIYMPGTVRIAGDALSDSQLVPVVTELTLYWEGRLKKWVLN